MKKISLILTAVLLCTILFSGCDNIVRDDLVNYKKNLTKLDSLESKLDSDYSSTVTENLTDKQIASKFENKIIPETNNLIKEAKKVHPKTASIQKLHNKYLKTLAEECQAFILMEKALNKGDEAQLKTINKKLLDVSKLSKNYMDSLNSLKQKYNVN